MQSTFLAIEGHQQPLTLVLGPRELLYHLHKPLCQAAARKQNCSVSENVYNI